MNRVFCIHTKSPKHCDLYINFFSWNHVSAPKTDEDPIPIYGQPIEYQKTDALLNIAFNPSILEKYGRNAKNPLERDMLINLAFDFIEQQNAVVLARNCYEVAENFVCYGDEKVHVEKFRKLLKRKGSDTVNEVFDANNTESMPDDGLLKKFLNMNLNKPTDSAQESHSKPAKNLIQELKSNSTESSSRPDFDFKIVSKNKCELMEIRIHLEKVQSISQCGLSVDNDRILTLNTNGLYDALNIPLRQYENTYNIDTDNINAKFVRNKCTLKILLALKRK
jgi:hypothetical protein